VTTIDQARLERLEARMRRKESKRARLAQQRANGATDSNKNNDNVSESSTFLLKQTSKALLPPTSTATTTENNEVHHADSIPLEMVSGDLNLSVNMIPSANATNTVNSLQSPSSMQKSNSTDKLNTPSGNISRNSSAANLNTSNGTTNINVNSPIRSVEKRESTDKLSLSNTPTKPNPTNTSSISRNPSTDSLHNPPSDVNVNGNALTPSRSNTNLLNTDGGINSTNSPIPSPTKTSSPSKYCLPNGSTVSLPPTSPSASIDNTSLASEDNITDIMSSIDSLDRQGLESIVEVEDDHHTKNVPNDANTEEGNEVTYPNTSISNTTSSINDNVPVATDAEQLLSLLTKVEHAVEESVHGDDGNMLSDSQNLREHGLLGSSVDQTNTNNNDNN
jgi:hypothetical protein